MKKLLLFLILLIGVSTYGTAQPYTEVVYLKNGSIIRGSFIQQTSNDSLRIRTTDGDIFICSMDEVEKITKEENLPVFKNRQRPALKGYKGFFDAGYLWDIRNSNTINANKLELSTSHGFQFNNHFYIGGGVALDRYNDAECTAVPIFADFRANFLNKKLTPFSNVRLGYTAGDITGVYVSLAAGLRITLKAKMALNLKVEFASQGHDELIIAHWFGYTDEYETLNTIGVKVGFEF